MPAALSFWHASTNWVHVVGVVVMPALAKRSLLKYQPLATQSPLTL